MTNRDFFFLLEHEDELDQEFELETDTLFGGLKKVWGDQPSDAASVSLALCDGGVLGAVCLFC